MAANPTHVAYTASKSSNSSSQIANSIGTPAAVAGDVFVACVVFDNITASTPTVTGIGVQSGETATWQRVASVDADSASAGAAVRAEVWAIKTTVAWSGQYFVDFSAAITAKVCAMVRVTGCTSNLSSAPDITGTATPVYTTTGTTPAAGDLVVMFGGYEGADVVHAPTTAGWTVVLDPANAINKSSAGGGNASNVTGLAYVGTAAGGAHPSATYGSALADSSLVLLTLSQASTGPAPAGIASAESVGSPTVTPGAVATSPGGVATAEAVGSPTVSQITTLSPTGIGTAEVVGSPTVSAGPVAVSPAGIGSAASVGSPTVTAGSGLSPSGISSGESVGSPTVTAGLVAVTPAGIGSGQAFGSLTVSAGAVSVAPTGIGSAGSVGGPTVTAGAVAAAPVGIGSVEAVGSASVGAGPVAVSPGGVASAQAIGSPTVVLGSPPVQPVSPPGMGTAEATGVPSLGLGPVAVVPAGISGTESVGAPSLAIIVATGTPAERRYSIPADLRRLTIPPELRRVTVAAESRRVAVPPDPRASTVPSEPRRLVAAR